MPWELDNDRPIYLQLMERIQQDIVSGIYKPGDRHPNTMQKALSELDRSGLVYSQRTSGRFITEDTQLLDEMKTSLASEHILQFLEKMKQLGFQKEETAALIQKALKEVDL